MNDEANQSVSVVDTPIPVQETVPAEPVSESVIESTSIPKEEVPIDPVVSSEPTQSIPVQPAPTQHTSNTSQPQSLAQQDQIRFLRTLLAKAKAKIQFNK